MVVSFVCICHVRISLEKMTSTVLQLFLALWSVGTFNKASVSLSCVISWSSHRLGLGEVTGVERSSVE